MNRRIWLFAASISLWAVVNAPASAQEFTPIAGFLKQVTAGREEVWGINAALNVYRFNPSAMQFAQVTGQLTQIAVGGGSLLQNDVVWGLNAAGEIYQYNFNAKKFVQVQGNLSQITVGDGYTDSCHAYEVWGVGTYEIDYRYNFCTSSFDQVPTGTQIPGFGLSYVKTGGGDVWGLDDSSDIYQYNFVMQAWVRVPGSLAQIAVGENDVWGINFAGHAYRFEGSAGFVQIDGSATFSQIAAGGDGVWGLGSPGSSIVRFDPNVQTAVTVPGSLKQIAVGYGAGIWGVNSSDGIFSFVRP